MVSVHVVSGHGHVGQQASDHVAQMETSPGLVQLDVHVHVPQGEQLLVVKAVVKL